MRRGTTQRCPTWHTTLLLTGAPGCQVWAPTVTGEERWCLHVWTPKLRNFGAHTCRPQCVPDRVDFGVCRCEHQSYVTLAPTSVGSNPGSKKVGIHTCRAQSYVTLALTRVGGKITLRFRGLPSVSTECTVYEYTRSVSRTRVVSTEYAQLLAV
mgnify:CR=1 FL=1